MPPKKRKAEEMSSEESEDATEDEESGEEADESNEEQESSAEEGDDEAKSAGGDVSMASEESAPNSGFACYIVGHTKIEDAKAAVDRMQIVAFPTPIPSFHALHVEPVQVASGARHTLVLGSDKRVYAWGCNAHGQLGTKPTKLPYSYQWTPLRQLTNKRVSRIACGANHCLALTELGMVFAWGSNSSGQLGTTMSKEFRAEPQAVPKLCLVTRVAGGGDASYAVDKTGDLYVWGNGEAGQFGVGGTPAAVGKPMKVSYFEENDIEVEEVAVGDSHVVVRSGRQFYTAGNGEWGKLGYGGHKSLTEFREIDVDFDKRERPPKVTASQHATYILTSVKPTEAGGEETAMLRCCGRLGPSSDESVMVPTLCPGMPIPPVTAVSGGRGWHMLRTDDGALYTWGANPACAQMGLFGRDVETRTRRTHPQHLTLLDGRYVHSFSCAREYAMIFVDKSKSTVSEDIIRVPVFGRLTAEAERMTSGRQVTYETARKAFLESCEHNAVAAADEVSEATLDGPSREIKGASNLREGDEVSVWMTDVWAWGTVAAVKPDNMFTIRWAREDWAADPMDVELLSDNEDVDCDSDERWTYGFYQFWSSDDESDSDEDESEESEEAKEPAKKGAKKAAKKPGGKRR